MFCNRKIVVKLAIVVGLICTAGFEMKALAMENFNETDHLFDIFNSGLMCVMKQSRMVLDPSAVKGVYGSFSRNLLEECRANFFISQKGKPLMNEKDLDDLLYDLLNEKRKEKLNRLRLTFERIILDYFFTNQERDNYKNIHKNEYSLDREFDDLFIDRLNRNHGEVKFTKEAILGYLINTYLNMVSHYVDCGSVKNVFKVVFNRNKEVEAPETSKQQVKIHFSPQMFAKIYREGCLKGNVKKGDAERFSSPEDFKKLCFEIRDEKKPNASIYLACSLNDLDKGCRVYGENGGCCDCRVMLENEENAFCLSEQRTKSRCFNANARDHIFVPLDFMIVYGWRNILTKNELIKLEDGREYIITVYDDAFVNGGKISSLGNVLYSEKIKANLQKTINVVDSAYKCNVAHTRDFDIIFWLKYYFHNLGQQNKDQLKDLKVKPNLKFRVKNKNSDYPYADL